MLTELAAQALKLTENTCFANRASVQAMPGGAAGRTGPPEALNVVFVVGALNDRA